MSAFRRYILLWMRTKIRMRHVNFDIKCIFCAFIISVPVFSIYAGYAIGNYLMPSTRPFADREVMADTSQLNYSFYNSHNLSITFAGGIGNQMFQYASLYGIAKANGLKPVVPKHSLVAQLFPHLRAQIQDENMPRTKPKVFLERGPNMFDGRGFSLNFMHNLHLDGFFQSWRYFDHVRSDLKKQFSFPPKMQDKIHKFLSNALSKYKEFFKEDAASSNKDVHFVGIHVRREDFLSPVSQNKGYTVATAKYFHNAMTFFESKYSHVIFVVCSDDYNWSKINVKSDSQIVVFSDWLDFPSYDLHLLSACNHTILSTGTFGWWGAWLAGGDVIYYLDYPRQGSPLARDFIKKDFYLPQWLPV